MLVGHVGALAVVGIVFFWLQRNGANANSTKTERRIYMTQLTSGQAVKLKVTFTLNDGTVVPASPEDQPMEMVVGQESGFKPIDDALAEMDADEVKSVSLTPDEAFGMPDPNLVMEIPREQVQAEGDIAPGMHMQMQTPEGQQMVAIIHEVTDTYIKVDANHPLAGEDLEMKVQVVG